MKNPNLITRSAYTFFNSLLKISDIIDLSFSNGFTNAFLVDKNIMYGAAEFYALCLKNDIKPIIGLEVDVDGLNKILIAKNYYGYQELMKISSDINLGNELQTDNSNLFVLDKVVKPVLYKKRNDISALKDFNAVSGKEFNEECTHFLNREQFEKKYGQDILNEVDSIIDSVNIEIPERKNILPTFHIEGIKVNGKEHLEKLLKENLMNLLNKDKTLDRDAYISRVSYELGVISEMGFENYFLIVADIIEWSKHNGIMVGPGRGSAPGSLISYLLDITTIDPIKNNLLFERFLNPERVSMPDIDIDFEDVRRDEVIEYIATKYGKDNVAQIITYQTLKAKMSFKDVARNKGLAVSEANAITKLIAEDLTLEEVYNTSKAFKEKIDSTEMLTEIFESAKLIEGLPRQFSTHAAGVVLSDNPIYKSVPVQKGYGSILQTQYSMDYMEYNGLLKIDILGLRNLSFIKETISLIKENQGIDVDLDNIDFNDSKVYSYLAAGKTSGVFQLESPGMKASLSDIKVSKFEDVVATTSLFRPGPVKMIPEFASRKRGESKFEYLNDDIKKILEPTYGVIVYQEQIMQLVQAVAKFSLAKADILRRAIGKKDLELLESLKEEFFKGGIENGYQEKDINEMYDLIHEFSNYGFNRSHAFAYTTISYWLAWLKINYKLEFMASLLNSVIGNVTKTSEYISEAEDLGIVINSPSIINSSSDYKIINGEVFIGLRTIKGVGESLIKTIYVLQPNINSKMNIVDFFIEADRHGITTSALKTLIKAGTLSDFGFNKETLLSFLPRLEEYIKMIKSKKDDVIEYKVGLVPAPVIQEIESPKEKDYFNEVMGFGLNDGELKEEFKTIESKLNINSNSLEDLKQDAKVEFVGEIISIREVTTKYGKKMAFISINNGSRKVSGTIWPAVYDKFANIIKAANKLVFYGTADFKRQETIIINKMEEIK